MCNTAQRWINHEIHFDLKLNIIQQTDYSITLLVHYQDQTRNYTEKRSRGSLICQHVFPSLSSGESADIKRILQLDTMRLSFTLLNNNGDNYSVFKVANIPQIDTSFEYHLRTCNWMVIDELTPLFLYHVQMENVHHFYNRLDANSLHSQTSAMEALDCSIKHNDQCEFKYESPNESQSKTKKYADCNQPESAQVKKENTADLSLESKVRAIVSQYEWTEADSNNVLSFRKSGKRMDVWFLEKESDLVSMYVLPLPMNKRIRKQWADRKKIKITIEDFGVLMAELEIILIDGDTEDEADDSKEMEYASPRKRRKIQESPVESLVDGNEVEISAFNLDHHSSNIALLWSTSTTEPPAPKREPALSPMIRIKSAGSNDNGVSEDWDDNGVMTEILDALLNPNPMRIAHENQDGTTIEMNVIQSAIYNKSADRWHHKLTLNPNHMQKLDQWLIALNRDSQRPLNVSQRSGIGKAMLSPLSLIHGPPGTGKSTTTVGLVSAILVTMRKHRMQITNTAKIGKIIVSGPTHAAINQLLEKAVRSLIANPTECPSKCGEHCQHLTILRLGDPDLCPKEYRPFCLRIKVEFEIEILRQKYKGQKPRKDVKEIREEAVCNMYKAADVVFGTVCSLGFMRGDPNRYDWLILDECGQILDSWMNVAVNRLYMDSNKSNAHLILVGDPQQLRPVIRSELENVYRTLFEVLVNAAKQDKDPNQSPIYELLDTQYRMPEKLIRFSNTMFYGGRIKSHQSQPENLQLCAQIEGIMYGIEENNAYAVVFCKKDTPMYLVSIRNATTQSVCNGGNKSKQNQDEALLITNKILRRLDSAVSIGVISLYKPQANLIKKYVFQAGLNEEREDHQKIMISTVDAFQGMEKDVIILSLLVDVVRKGTLFTDNLNRMNVAITRCSKALIVVTSTDLAALAHSPGSNIWSRFFSHSSSPMATD